MKPALDINKMNPEELVETMDKLTDLFFKGKTIAEVQGLSKDQLESIYTIAHTLYSQGKYKKAIELFRFLALYDHMEERYWYALGAAFQMIEDYDSAIEAYEHAHILDVHDLSILMHISACFLAKNDLEKAESALEFLIHLAKHGGEGFKHLEMVERAEELLKMIEKKKIEGRG